MCSSRVQKEIRHENLHSEVWDHFPCPCINSTRQGHSALLPSLTIWNFPLWTYSIMFLLMNVWVLHNAACAVGKMDSNCLFKWQLYPQGMPALCMFGLCVHLCTDVTFLCAFHCFCDYVEAECRGVWLILVTVLSAVRFFNYQFHKSIFLLLALLLALSIFCCKL